MKISFKLSCPFHSRQGFTLIEVIITIVLLGLVMIPLGFISIEYMRGVALSRDLTIAEGLAKTEMAKINSLSYADATLADGYDNTTGNYEGYPYDLRRIVSYVSGWGVDLKEVQVIVYPSQDTSRSLIKLVNYIADVTFGPGCSGGITTGGQADSLAVSGGNISGATLENIDLGNTSSDPITITGVIINFDGSPGIKLKLIAINGVKRWNGNASSGSTITLNNSFTLSANAFYNNAAFFTFSKNLSSVSIVFIMADGTQTGSYSW